EHAAGLAAFDRRATLDQGPALRRDRRETVAAGVAVQGVQRERRLAAPDPLVARQQRGAHVRGGALALREGALAFGGDLLALPRERLAQRGLPRPHLFERPLGRRLRLVERPQLGGERGEGLIGRRHRLILLL